MADYEHPDLGETKARREVTFCTVGLAGQHATFQHEKTTWMAAPAAKARALFGRAQSLADRAARAQKALSRVVAAHPELYVELRPVLLLLEESAGRVPWGSALDAEIAAAVARRAAEKKRRNPKFTH